VGPLKVRLAADPTDEHARRELVAAYRAAGHPDQAGRYGAALEGLATAAELRAYGATLRGIQADEERTRLLSRIPPGAEITPATRKAMDSSAESDDVLGDLLPFLWVAVALAITIALVATFFSVLAGYEDARGVAAVSGVVVLAIAAFAAAWTSVWCGTRWSWRSGTGWAATTAGLIVAAVLLAR
jgi:ABC-type glycerol-3-phosphate transport system permease component